MRTGNANSNLDEKSDTNRTPFSNSDDLASLIERNGIETHFHSVTAIRRGCVVGLEALSRGVTLEGALIAPHDLFAEAERVGLTCELDRACQRGAFQAFAPLHAVSPNLMLFVNVHPDCIEDALQPDAGLVALSFAFNIAPQCVVVELLETAIKDNNRLHEAIDAYKKHGFLVALDDVGKGHSSLNRILQVRPDILKADRSLIENIEDDFYKQEIYKAILQMGEKLGGWVVTEGVEKQSQALVAMGLGADLFQGFYFSKPKRLTVSTTHAAQKTTHDLQRNVKPLRDTAERYKEQTIQKLQDEREARAERREVSLSIARTLQEHLDAAGMATVETSNAPSSDKTVHSADEESSFLETALRAAIAPYPRIEAASLMDAQGIQITETVLHPYPKDSRKVVMYPPPAKGDNHALKEYFFVLAETAIDRYETMPYVPLPTGDMCITISLRVRWDDAPCVLCLHFFVAHADPSPKSPTPLE